jgi:hypothetical protein
MVVIVSEETGGISVAREGVLTTNVTPPELLEMLSRDMNLQASDRTAEFAGGEN